jgi:hypothetical protein
MNDIKPEVIDAVQEFNLRESIDFNQKSWDNSYIKDVWFRFINNEYFIFDSLKRINW